MTRTLVILSSSLLLTTTPIVAETIDAEEFVSSSRVLDVDALAAAVEDGDTVVFANLTYRLKKPLVLDGLSNVTLAGGGMEHTIFALHNHFYTAWAGYADADDGNRRALVAIVFKECTGCIMKDIRLSGRGHVVGGDHKGIYGVLLSGCDSCKLLRVRFLYVGGSGGEAKGGHVAITATQHLDNAGNRIARSFAMPYEGFRDFAPLEETGDPNDPPISVIGKASDNNRIVLCEFYDNRASGPLANFGVRLMTNWLMDLPDDQFPFPVSNTLIRNCKFFGGFNDNAIEIGGPGCVNNEVRGCLFQNCRQAPMECDKGARDNEFHMNTVDGLDPASGGGINSQTVAIRDAGLPELWDGTQSNPNQGRGLNPTRYSSGNSYHDNTIRNIQGVGALTGLVAAALSEGCMVHDNTVTWNTIGTDNGVPAAIVFTGVYGVDVRDFLYSDNTLVGEADDEMLMRQFVNGISFDAAALSDQQLLITVGGTISALSP